MQCFWSKKKSCIIFAKKKLSKNLLIVESPAKKKTIQSYLGKDYIVESSVGHIRDLPKKGNKAIDIENGFTPNYVVSEDKKKIDENCKNM